MKFIVSSTSLLRQLQNLSPLLQASTALPVLENFLFEINKNELVISSSDLESTMSIKIQVESKESGAICIPARILMDTLKTFSEQPLTFSIDAKKNSVEIVSDYGKYKLTGFSGEDFPKISEITFLRRPE